MISRRLALLVALSVALFIGVPLCAHESPEHTLEELNAHLREDGPSTPLLMQRASLYRVLNERERAIADLRQVLRMEPDHQGAMVELSRLYLAGNNLKPAMQWIQQAIVRVKSDKNVEPFLLAQRAAVFAAQKQLPNALRDYDTALAGDAEEVDWYLERAGMQETLKLSSQRIAGLKHGYERTKSEVLLIEWIEACLDGGHAGDVSSVIEQRLAAARLKSSWLIRRARAGIALNKGKNSTTAATDLRAAIAELTERLRPDRPDPDLLLDRALANLLLDNRKAAIQDVAVAEKWDASPRLLQRLKSRLG